MFDPPALPPPDAGDDAAEGDWDGAEGGEMAEGVPMLTATQQEEEEDVGTEPEDAVRVDPVSWGSCFF